MMWLVNCKKFISHKGDDSMINNPKVSVIVPVYNVEKYLKRCLDSLINQTLKDIEIIVVNDGSTDNSLDILNKYAENDSRIKVIDKENSGVSDCRNIAMKQMKGKYIMFVDSDDWIDNNALEIMYTKIEEEKSDLVMCTYMREFANHSKEKIFNLPEIELYEKDEIKKLHRKLFGPIDNELGNPEDLYSLGTIWAKLYKVDVIKKNNIEFEDLKLIGSNEDGLFNIYVFNKINKAVFINKPLYHYCRDNPKSITSGYNQNLKNKWINLFNIMREFIEINNLDNSYINALNNRICMSTLGLGLNECSKANKISKLNKIKNIKEILSDEVIVNAFSKFQLNYFPIHWRLFYFFNKNKLVLLSYLMLNTIEFLRKRVK